MQPVFARKLEVALIMGRNRHDRAGAVAHEHIVRNPDRYPLAIDRVHGVTACEDPRLGAFGRESINLGYALRATDVPLHLFAALR